MKPFNINLAKAKHPIQTRDGRPVRIICYDVKNPDYDIVALVNHGDNYELVKTYKSDGRSSTGMSNSSYDLFMVSTEYVKYVNIYNLHGLRWTNGQIFDTIEEAKSNILNEAEYIETATLKWHE